LGRKLVRIVCSRDQKGEGFLQRKPYVKHGKAFMVDSREDHGEKALGAPELVWRSSVESSEVNFGGKRKDIPKALIQGGK